MSDENSPPIRLKPRLDGATPVTPPAAPAAPTPVPPAAAATPAESAGAVAAAASLRLKPRVAGESPTAAGPTAPPAPPARAPVAPVAPPATPSPVAPASAHADAKPKFSLKPREAADAPHAPVLPPVSTGLEVAPSFEKPSREPPSSEVKPAAEPPRLSDAPAAVGPAETSPAGASLVPPTADFPAPSEEAAAPVPAPNFPPPPGLKSPPPGAGGLPPPLEIEPVPEADAVKPAAPGGKRTMLLGALLAVIALGAGAYFVLPSFLGTEPAPLDRPVIVKKAPPTKTEPASSPTSSPSAPAGAAGPIARTKETLARVEANQTAPSGEVIAAASAPATVTSPTITAGSPAVASPAFRAWVMGLKIGGVRAGETPRIFVERSAYSPGDLVNPALGIVFAGYNAEKRMLVFRDQSGATVERRP